MIKPDVEYELNKLEVYINLHVNDPLTQLLLLGELNLIRAKLNYI
jgi:hypothetical protein